MRQTKRRIDAVNFRWLMQIMLFLGVLGGTVGERAYAQQSAPSQVAVNALPALVPIPLTADDALIQSSGTDALVRAILLQNLPREYENSKKWGQTKRRWNGLDVSLDGLRLDTKRRWKEVNHGTWTRYRAWLIDPENQLRIQFANLRQTGDQPTAFDLTVEARIGATGRLSEWNRGVQLYSFSADAEGKIRLQVNCELELQFDATRLPPDVLLAPRVTGAKLELLEFQLHRISEADGPLVHKLGDSLHDELNHEINARREKLVEKLNRAIDKNRDHLRLSLHDLLTGM